MVDRGPYVAGREFDLTEATKQALGFGDLGEVWSTTLSVGRCMGTFMQGLAFGVGPP